MRVVSVCTLIAACAGGKGTNPEGRPPGLVDDTPGPAIVLCAKVGSAVPRPTQIAVELETSIQAFLAASGNSLIEYREMDESRCPDLSGAGCHGENEKIFCDRNTLEYALDNMARLESWLLGTSLGPESQSRFEAALSALGYARFKSVQASPTIAPRALADDAVWSGSRDYLIFFVLGHEAYHAFNGCPFSRPSAMDAKGDYRRIVELQKMEVFCPNPPSPVEVFADECGLRALEIVNARLVAADSSPLANTWSRALALEFLARGFLYGLGSTTSQISRWNRDGYLVPSLRVLAVRREFGAMEGSADDLRIGPCAEALNALWDSADASRLCVSGGHVLLMPLRGVPHSIFPGREMDSMPGYGRQSCLDSTVPLPDVPVAAHRRVKIDLVAIREDNRHSLAMGSDVNAMISRLPFQASVAACLGERKHTRITMHVDENGTIDSVQSPDKQFSACLKKAVASNGYLPPMDLPAPIDPGDEDESPNGFSFTLEVSLVASQPH